MKRLILLSFLILNAIILWAAEREIYSGNLGDNATYSITSENGVYTLYINGTGDTPDYVAPTKKGETYDSPLMAIEDGIRALISNVVIGDGINTIGNNTVVLLKESGTVNVSLPCSLFPKNGKKKPIYFTKFGGTIEIDAPANSPAAKYYQVYITKGTTATATYTVVNNRQHADVEKIAAVEPTCTKEGNYAYYHCKSCNVYSTTNTFATTTTVADQVRPVRHTLTQIPAFETSSPTGFPEFYRCGNCRKNFAEREAQNEVSLESVLTSLNGSGTAEDPYQIGQQSDLDAIYKICFYFMHYFVDNTSKLSDQFIVTKDFTITGFYLAPSNFCGSIDGQGHTITYNKPQLVGVNQEFGLFASWGYLLDYGPVKVKASHLNFDGSINISNNRGINFGALCGHCNALSAEITDCHNKTNISFSGGPSLSKIGGIIGETVSATINNCSNEGNIHLDSFGTVGGIVGQSSKNTTISNCFNTGTISGTGGSKDCSTSFAGIVASSGNVYNCYNTGNVFAETNKSEAGGVSISGIASSTATVKGCLNLGMLSVTGAYQGSTIEPVNSRAENSYYLGEAISGAKCTALQIVGSPKVYQTAEGKDVVTLLNGVFDDTTYHKWAYDEQERPCFAWQSLDANDDRKISIADVSVIIDAMQGKIVNGHADADADGKQTLQDLQRIIDRTMEK